MYIKNCKFWSNSVQLHREEIASVLPPRSKLYWASNRFSKINILSIIWRLEMDHMAQKYLVFKKCSILNDWWKKMKIQLQRQSTTRVVTTSGGIPRSQARSSTDCAKRERSTGLTFAKIRFKSFQYFWIRPKLEIYENTWNICCWGSSWRLGDRWRPRFHPRQWFGRRRVSDLLQDSRRAGLNYPSLESLLKYSLPWFPFK